MGSRIITIVGNIGSGKSTLLPIVAKALKAKMLDADSLFQTIDPFREQYLRDLKRWAFANELWLTTQRAHMLTKHVQKNPKKLTIVDSGLLMSWVYTYSHFITKKITIAEWDLYQQLFKELTTNSLEGSLVIFLDCSTKALLQRIKKRGRDYELKFYTPAYLNQIQKGLVALKKQFAKWHIQSVTISESEAGNFDQNAEDRKRMIEIIYKSYKNLK